MLASSLKMAERLRGRTGESDRLQDRAGFKFHATCHPQAGPLPRRLAQGGPLLAAAVENRHPPAHDARSDPGAGREAGRGVGLQDVALPLRVLSPASLAGSLDREAQAALGVDQDDAARRGAPRFRNRHAHHLRLRVHPPALRTRNALRPGRGRVLGWAELKLVKSAVGIDKVEDP